MTTEQDYAETLREAERALRAAKTADDIREAWRKHLGTLGHRALGRLLLGRTADELLARRSAREQD